MRRWSARAIRMILAICLTNITRTKIAKLHLVHLNMLMDIVINQAGPNIIVAVNLWVPCYWMPRIPNRQSKTWKRLICRKVEMMTKHLESYNEIVLWKFLGLGIILCQRKTYRNFSPKQSHGNSKIVLTINEFAIKISGNKIVCSAELDGKVANNLSPNNSELSFFSQTDICAELMKSS